jgi:cytochrome c
MLATDLPSGVAATLLACAALLHSSVGHADELSDAAARSFLNAKGCNACHAVDEVRIGPPFRNVARRYAGADDAVAESLMRKIRFGGAGAWGVIPMSSNPQLTDEELAAIARWLLHLDVSVGASR